MYYFAALQAVSMQCAAAFAHEGKNIKGPPPVPLAEVVETVAKHQAAGFIPSTVCPLPEFYQTLPEIKELRLVLAPRTILI